MRGWWIAIPVGALACSAGADRATEVVMRDSAGIRLVENLDLGWQPGRAWSVADTPTLDLGAADAAPEHQFHMVMGVVTLSDGRIVVANAGTQEVRWYDATGGYVATAGGEGQGPGEFTGLVALGVLPGDTVIAYDTRLRRFSVFDADGTFARSAPLVSGDRPGMDYPVFLGTLHDGSLVMVGRILQTEGMAEGPVRAEMPVYVFGSDGHVRDSLGTFHGWEAFVTIRRSGQVVGMAIGDRPFGRSTSVTSVGDGIVVGTPHTFAFEVFDPDGTLRAIVRLARGNQPLTSEDLEAFEASLIERDEDDNLAREQRREAAAHAYPDSKPAYASALRGDKLGNVWVPGFAVVGQHPPRWSVFDAEGRYQGDLEMPRRFRVFEIGGDYVLGVWRDELDVERVRRYALNKP